MLPISDVIQNVMQDKKCNLHNVQKPFLLLFWVSQGLLYLGVVVYRLHKFPASCCFHPRLFSWHAVIDHDSTKHVQFSRVSWSSPSLYGDKKRSFAFRESSPFFSRRRSCFAWPTRQKTNKKLFSVVGPRSCNSKKKWVCVLSHVKEDGGVTGYAQTDERDVWRSLFLPMRNKITQAHHHQTLYIHAATSCTTSSFLVFFLPPIDRPPNKCVAIAQSLPL